MEYVEKTPHDELRREWDCPTHGCPGHLVGASTPRHGDRARCEPGPPGSQPNCGWLMRWHEGGSFWEPVDPFGAER